MIRNFETGTVVTVSGNSANIVRLTDDNGTSSNRKDANNIAVLVNAASVSGTSPSYTIEVQWSHDGTTFVSASTPDTFTAITATGTALKTFQAKGPYARLKYTVTGTTPSATLTITGYVTI